MPLLHSTRSNTCVSFFCYIYTPAQIHTTDAEYISKPNFGSTCKIISIRFQFNWGKRPADVIGDIEKHLITNSFQHRMISRFSWLTNDTRRKWYMEGLQTTLNWYDKLWKNSTNISAKNKMRPIFHRICIKANHLIAHSLHSNRQKWCIKLSFSVRFLHWNRQDGTA